MQYNDEFVKASAKINNNLVVILVQQAFGNHVELV